jgi:16S rRNA (guanine527-N7)-methyltransferase
MEKTQNGMELIQQYFSDFSEKQLQQLTALETLYTEWNQKINVVSRKDIDSLYLHHVLHSLSIAAIANFNAGLQIVDVGTGGGFPGLPLAIFFPEVEFHCVDSIAKKLKVVQGIADEIGLTNLTTQHTRAEDIKGRKFHFAISRAVAPLKDLWRWSAPLLRKGETANLPNGLICLKGGDLAQEIFESGLRPRMMEISGIFPEPYFKEKFILHVAKN